MQHQKLIQLDPHCFPQTDFHTQIPNWRSTEAEESGPVTPVSPRLGQSLLINEGEPPLIIHLSINEQEKKRFPWSQQSEPPRQSETGAQHAISNHSNLMTTAEHV